jgi:two-component system, sensor histidine kinase and response regulator
MTHSTPDLEGALDAPLLDPAALVRLREWGGDTLVGKMVALYLKNAPERLEDVRAGLAADDAPRAERGAHSLKSSSANLGAERLRRLCQLVENAAEVGALEQVRELLPSLEEAFEHTLQGLVRRSPAPSDLPEEPTS